MTPPKKKPIKVVEHSEKFKSKPEQIAEQVVSCSQSANNHSAIPTMRVGEIEIIDIHKIIRRALEKEKEKKGD